MGIRARQRNVSVPTTRSYSGHVLVPRVGIMISISSIVQIKIQSCVAQLLDVQLYKTEHHPANTNQVKTSTNFCLYRTKRIRSLQLRWYYSITCLPASPPPWADHYWLSMKTGCMSMMLWCALEPLRALSVASLASMLPLFSSAKTSQQKSRVRLAKRRTRDIVRIVFVHMASTMFWCRWRGLSSLIYRRNLA